jgi:hypothetical protein
MGFDLTDLGNEDNTILVNFWNWRPTVEIIAASRIIDAERLEMMRHQCTGVEVTAIEARLIAEVLTRHWLSRLKPNGRVLLDLSITYEPDTFENYQGDEWTKNYSATETWLREFHAFCSTCKGFKVF